MALAKTTFLAWRRPGIIGNIIVGIIGGLLGGFILGLFGIGVSGLFWTFITALIGAIVLLWIAKMVTGGRGIGDRGIPHTYHTI